MKHSYIIAVLGIIVLIAIGLGLLRANTNTTAETPQPSATSIPTDADGGTDGALDDVTPPSNDVTEIDVYQSETVLGQSVDGRDIVATHFGNGSREVILAAGLHGSYSLNTSRLANELISYLAVNEAVVPSDVRVTVIPNLNPDGAANPDQIAGRFNSNDVDLNRNFACDWAPVSNWQDREVSGGAAAFSEPEALAVRDYLSEINPVAAIVWYAAEGRVYASACDDEPSVASLALANTFAAGSGYPAADSFEAYQINGDMVNWMAAQGVPAISVLLSDRTNTERSKNIDGLQTVLQSLSIDE